MNQGLNSQYWLRYQFVFFGINIESYGSFNNFGSELSDDWLVGQKERNKK